MVETSVALSLQCLSLSFALSLCSRVRLHAHKHFKVFVFHCTIVIRACACVRCHNCIWRFGKVACVISPKCSVFDNPTNIPSASFASSALHRKSYFNCTFSFPVFLSSPSSSFLPGWNANHLQIIIIKRDVFFSSNRPLRCANILDFVLTQGSRAPSCFRLRWFVLFELSCSPSNQLFLCCFLLFSLSTHSTSTSSSSVQLPVRLAVAAYFVFIFEMCVFLFLLTSLYFWSKFSGILCNFFVATNKLQFNGRAC